jgi:hypothetical protein
MARCANPGIMQLITTKRNTWQKGYSMGKNLIISKDNMPQAKIDPTKVYSNGHKTLGSMEALALQQLLKGENVRRENFHARKHEMKRDRNPLTGEATPREGEGEPVINPNWEERPPPPKKELTGKIGVRETKYAILGNSPDKPKPREPERKRP